MQGGTWKKRDRQIIMETEIQTDEDVGIDKQIVRERLTDQWNRQTDEPTDQSTKRQANNLKTD